MPAGSNLGEFNAILEKVEKLLAEIEEKIMKMPQSLPEEFANNPDVKRIDVNKIQDAAWELNKALAMGDIQGAIDKANELLARINDLNGALKAAGGEQNIPFSNTGILAGKIKGIIDDIEKAIDSQRGLISESGALEKKRYENILKAQDELLNVLAEKQAELIARAEKSKAGYGAYGRCGGSGESRPACRTLVPHRCSR